ncbi:MAG: cysteine desulfurase [Breznakibacter sp.]
MSFEKNLHGLPDSHDWQDPSVIDQTGNHIYNEFPDASRLSPGQASSCRALGSDLLNPGAVRQLLSQLSATVTAEKFNIPGPGSSEGPDWSNIVPPSAFKEVSQLPGIFATAPNDYYFLSSESPSAHQPLSVHADNLIVQQTLEGHEAHRSSLGDFVRKVQASPVATEQVFTGETFYQQGLGNVGHAVFPWLADDVRQQKPSPENYRSLGRSNNLAGNHDIFDVENIRRDFPILHQQVHGKPLIWFDNAATTQKPASVIEELARFYATDNSNIHRAAHTLAARSTDAYEGAREKVRHFIGASSSEEIVFVRGTTEAINLVAQTWGRQNIRPGDEILISLLEHHANIVPWQMLAKEKDATLKAIPVNDKGEILMDEYVRLLTPRVKLLAITQASNGLGTILPVKEMIGLARRYDLKVLVDGAQSVAHIPVDVQHLDADFFVFSGHKIFAPNGIGVVYGKRHLLETMPPWQGGGNMIKDVRLEETSFNGLPNKFEAGTPNVADAIGLGVALDYVSKIGMNNIAAYEHSLTQYGMQQLATIPGLRFIGTSANKVGVLSFVHNQYSSEQIGKYLDSKGIAVRAGHHCTQPSLRRFGVESTVRPSLAFYNTYGEIDRLVDTLKHIRVGNL